MNSENYEVIPRSATVLCLKKTPPATGDSFDEVVRREANTLLATEDMDGSLEILNGSFSNIKPIVEVAATMDPPKKRRRKSNVKVLSTSAAGPSRPALPSPVATADREMYAGTSSETEASPDVPDFAGATTSTPIPHGEEDGAEIVVVKSVIDRIIQEQQAAADFSKSWYADVQALLRDQCANYAMEQMRGRARTVQQYKVLLELINQLQAAAKVLQQSIRHYDVRVQYCEDMLLGFPMPPDLVNNEDGDGAGGSAAM